MKMILSLLSIVLVTQPVRAAEKNAALYVQIKETKLRSQPQFWALPVADLTYGSKLDPVSVDKADKAWIKVMLNGTEGYVHRSAVTSRKVVLTSTSGAQREVDSTSVVLAGKGFNRQVEGAYAGSKGLDFSVVDAVEKNRVEIADEAAFIKEGGLK